MTLEEQMRHALKSIGSYCKQITSGEYKPEPNENPLDRIHGITVLATEGLWNVVEPEPGESQEYPPVTPSEG